MTVSASGVTFIQSDYNAGEAQTATLDENGNYVIWVRDHSGVALPMTGGTGRETFVTIGMTLMAGAGLALGGNLVINKKRRMRTEGGARK